MINLNCCPKIKSTVQIQTTHQWVCFRTSINKFEFADTHGFIKALIKSMNGKNNISKLKKMMIKKFPSIASSEVVKLIKKLDKALLLEDAHLTYEGILTQEEVEKWGPHINFFDSFCTLKENKYAIQERLKNIKVSLFGSNAVSVHILSDLLTMGIQHIRIDPNGVKKSMAIDHLLTDEVILYHVESSSDILKMAQGTDIAICIDDNPDMKMLNLINEACVTAKIPLIAGNAETQLAYYFTILPGVTGCLACWQQAMNRGKKRRGSSRQQPRTRLEEKSGNASFVSLGSMLSGAMLTEFFKLVTGVQPPVAAGKALIIPMDTMLFETDAAWERQNNCRICGYE